MKAELRSYLVAGDELAALIIDRIYWDVRPQADPLPALVLQRIGGGTDHTYKGVTRLRWPRVQVKCMAATALEAEALEKAVMARLDGKAFVQDGVKFQCLCVDARDLTEVGATDAETIHCPSIDFKIIHKE